MKRVESVVGMEIHAQLKTSSKMFCACGTRFGSPPNTQVCPVCLGLPGALPVLNARAVELALRVGLAAGCRVLHESVFARKNYFYPDLPKGYQISQYDRPICLGGEIMLRVNDSLRPVRLSRIHLEEDAGKSLHPRDAGGDFSLLDFNRCGIPLLEIVSEPELGSPSEAVAFLEAVKQLLEYLEVCDCEMEKGSFRCDANVSVSKRGEKGGGVRTEIKNLNSFKSLEKALSFEIRRQTKILNDGGSVLQQTLLWDELKEECVPMRSKEEADDYRYFPEPDLPPVLVTEELLRETEKWLPELPWKRRERVAREYGLPSDDAVLLTSTRALADYFEECVSSGAEPKAAGNWIKTEVFRILKERGIGIETLPVGPAGLAELLGLIRDRVLSGTAGKAVFEEMTETGEPASKIVDRRGLEQITDRDVIRPVVAELLEAEADAVRQYIEGKERTLQYLVGQALKALGGRADPVIVREVVMENLARVKNDEE